MIRIFKLLLLSSILLLASMNVFAQQEQVQKYFDRPLLFKTFVKAKVNLTFMRFTYVNANIFLKDASLYYKQEGKLMRAKLDDVVSVDFDSTKFVKIGDQLGQLITSRGYNQLVCVTTIDVQKMKQRAKDGEGLGYFQIPNLDVFVELDNDKKDYVDQYPLKDTYYFITATTTIPANETSFKKHVIDSKKKQFKKLMYNKYWSWKDPTSLLDLFDYLPQAE